MRIPVEALKAEGYYRYLVLGDSELASRDHGGWKALTDNLQPFNRMRVPSASELHSFANALGGKAPFEYAIKPSD